MEVKLALSLDIAQHSLLHLFEELLLDSGSVFLAQITMLRRQLLVHDYVIE